MGSAMFSTTNPASANAASLALSLLSRCPIRGHSTGAGCSLILIQKTSGGFSFWYLGLVALTASMGVGLFALGRGLGRLLGAASLRRRPCHSCRCHRRQLGRGTSLERSTT